MIAIKLTGLDGLQTAITKTLKQAEVGTKQAMATFVKSVERDAKATLQHGSGGFGPTSNTGHLANSVVGTVIRALGSSSSNIIGKVTVTANYAAYIEFGTRKFAARYVATLPQDWKTYAATFKGKGGGTFDQFVQDLLVWIKNRGIRLEPKQMEQGDDFSFGKLRKSKKKKKQTILEGQQQLAYIFAKKIMVEGIRAQPFLYPAVVKHTPKLIEDIKKVFDA